MILPAGTFVVAEKRKTIPLPVKLAVVFRQGGADEKGVPFTQDDVGKVHFDHRPPLSERPFDTAEGDFVPPQNHPDFIFAIRKGTHDERTFGRKEGAEKTVTTRGSDVGNSALDRRVQRSEAIHRYRKAVRYYGQATADGLYPEIAALLARRDRSNLKIKGRGFGGRKRSMRRRA